MQDSLLRLPAVLSRVGYSRATVYAKIKAKEFPVPIKLGDRAVAWVSAEVDDWIRNRIAESRPVPKDRDAPSQEVIPALTEDTSRGAAGE